MPRYPGLTLRVLGSGEPAMGPGKAALIGQIEKTGSISAAARAMGMSYRRAWKLVDALNESFKERVVLTAVGGKRGGGAQVTVFGWRLVRLYHKMEDKASVAIAADLGKFVAHQRKLAKRESR